jgi:Protein of unknown function (DUF551)
VADIRGGDWGSLLAADLGERMTEWQPMETLPEHEGELLFWIVPKTSEEAGIDMDDPMFGTHDPYLFKGTFQSWSSLSKATHWMPLPQPPSPRASEGQ